ncbi:MAG TPA: nidogen-like domain-containing protein [Sedimentisphaerales bacterium]|nr:nidogen-like domain-containing protein [Sedimentisphaerales bacterium]HRS11522.1 nidogen-like domain-containing protein [Sedimentisphaerales bacterium]HRV48226.1 nidogen-like domain-containing protein [Sedimentisphaerales bacterium]
MKGLSAISVGVLAVCAAATAVRAITINATFDGFDATQQDVVQAAINRWVTMVGGHAIDILFTTSTDVLLATTSGWVTDEMGRPVRATIHVNTSEYNWTTRDPAGGQIDAMRGMMHEIAHAIGWTVALDRYAANVISVGGNRFYDLDHDGAFRADTDFDLIDVSWQGTHAPEGSGDLMQPYAPRGVRLYPSYQHAGVLTDAFDYSVMLDGLGGEAGYGDPALGRTDDGSSGLLDLPFQINLFGTKYDSFFVNNNGNVSFETAVSEPTPQVFPAAGQPMIAPYWADVDTRTEGSGAVYVASPGSDAVIVTWDGVGYFDQHADLTNDFQMVLRNRDDVAPGDFDIEFRYGQLQWTTGDASGGIGGLGGTAAQAGYDAGDGRHYLILPGSGTAAVLDLANLTNTPSNVAIRGLWVFPVRNGHLPGTVAENPLMPVLVDNGWRFDFHIGNVEDAVFVGSPPEMGYDYFVDFGANISAIELPTFADALYDLWLWNDVFGVWEDTGFDLMAGNRYDFSGEGVDAFRLLAAEAGLSPGSDEAAAFVTGLWFTSTGLVCLRQVPVTLGASACMAVVPLPGALGLSALGVLGLVVLRRRRIL